MLQFLLDTDHLTLFDLGHPSVGARLARQPPDAVGVNAVSVEEYLRGRLAAVAAARDGPSRILRYGHLLASIRLFQQFPLIAFDRASENQYQHLLGLRLRIGTQDLKIAAIALANNVVLLTRNRRDFGRVRGCNWMIGRSDLLLHYSFAIEPSVRAVPLRVARLIGALVSRDAQRSAGRSLAPLRVAANQRCPRASES